MINQVSFRIRRSLTVCILVSICGSCLADDTIPSNYSTQTSWNSGSIRELAKGGWGDGFTSSEGIDWFDESGSLSLVDAYYRIPLLIDSMPEVTGMSPADFDMDGDLDLILLHAQDSRAGWLEYTEQLQEWKYHPLLDHIYAPITSITSNLDNIGNNEIVFASTEDGIIVADLVAGEEWHQQNIAREFYKCIDLSCTDINADGYSYIVGMSEYTGGISWWSNPGAHGNEWVQHDVGRIPDEHTGMITGDINSDGQQEIVTIGNAGRIISVFRFEDDPTEPWLEHETSRAEDGFSRINVFYTDRSDNPSAMETAFHESDDRTLVKIGQCPVDTLHGINSLDIRYEYALGDIDGDGDTDICSRIGCYENIGRAPFWMFHPYEIDSVYSDYRFNVPDIRKLVCLDYDDDGLDELVLLSGNQLWYVDHIPEYTNRGELISQPLGLNEWYTWCGLSWEADVPEGTSVSVYFHFYQENHGWIGPFSESVSLREYYGEAISWEQQNSDNTQRLLKYYHFLQYKVEMATSNPTISPVLNSITVEWK